jgi:hypothetical protein
MSNSVKALVIFLLSFGLSVLVWYVPGLFFQKGQPADIRILMWVLYFFFPLIALLTGIASRIYIKKLWIGPIISLVASILTTTVLAIYIPFYVFCAFIGSFATPAHPKGFQGKKRLEPDIGIDGMQKAPSY